ncbi:MAG: hypothetical protein MZV63_68820 [Marinilabiliales bacterium]|nr:hypothetical protein [Marinilabiliales bacterium]
MTDTLTNKGDPQERTGLTFNLFTYDLRARQRPADTACRRNPAMTT